MNLLVLSLGFLIGIFSGIVGIGGGILMVPLLVWMAGMDQHKAQGTSLGALLAPVGALAFYEYWKKGNVDLTFAILLAIGFFLGGYFGAKWAQVIPDFWLRRIFAITMILVGVRMLFK